MDCDHNVFLRKRMMHNGTFHVGTWCNECNRFVKRDNKYWIKYNSLSDEQKKHLEESPVVKAPNERT